MHAEAADLLEAPCRRFLGRPTSPKPQGPRRFLMVGAERTGTNLLIGLLNQHAGCFCGGELFNSGVIAKGKLPWFDLEDAERDRLLELRLNDPLRFLAEIEKDGDRQGLRSRRLQIAVRPRPEPARGHGGAERRPLAPRDPCHAPQPAAPSRVGAAGARGQQMGGRGAGPSRRSGAMRRSRSTTSSAHSPAPNEDRRCSSKSLPAIRCCGSSTRIWPRGHCGSRRGRRNFWGLPPPSKPPFLNYRKTGAEALSEALTGGDELRAKLRRWAAFFDE